MNRRRESDVLSTRRRSSSRPWLAALITAASLPCLPAFGAQPERPEPQDEGKKLGERLIREAAAGESEDPMEKLLNLMDQAARKLEIEFDAGPQTQRLQASIVEQLDDAIRLAAAQRRASRTRSSSWTGEKRKRPPDGQTAERDPSSATADEGASPDAAAASAGAGVERIEPREGTLHETRRTWGLLPQRERDEILQGSQEDFLERYREWIERYYRALQETPE